MPYALGEGGAWFCDATCTVLARYGVDVAKQMRRSVKIGQAPYSEDAVGTPLEEHKQHAFKSSLPLSTVLELRAAF